VGQFRIPKSIRQAQVSGLAPFLKAFQLVRTTREKLRRAVAHQLGMEMQATSAGIGATDGSIPSLHAVAVMREMGIDISNHRSRQLKAEMAQAVDLVLAMTPKRAEQARAIVGTTVRVQTLGEYARVREAVDDPFGGTVERYQRTAEQIQRLLTEGLSRGRVM
jgi:protein-tyrosine-phosphatase